MGFAKKGTKYRWPMATIPYIFDSSVSEEDKDTITLAMKYWMEKTQAIFIEQTTEKAYIRFVTDTDLDGKNGIGGNSPIGYSGKKNQINLETGVAKGTVIHEIGHSIGLRHEHSRYDKDSYICLYTGNLTDEGKDQFIDKKQTEENSIVTEYDYHSIMHYGEGLGSDFNINPLGKSFESPVKTGQRDVLSKWDIDLARRILPSNFHNHSITEKNLIGKNTFQTKFNGYDIMESFTVGSRSFIFFYSSNSGKTTTQEVSESSVLTTVYEDELNKNINCFHFFQVSEKSSIRGEEENSTYLCVSHNFNDQGNCSIYKIKSNGKIGKKVLEFSGLSKKVSNIVSYSLDSGFYLLFYSTLGGDYTIKKIEGFGRVIENALSVSSVDISDSHSIGSGLTGLEAIKLNSSTYLMTYRYEDGVITLYSFSQDCCLEGTIKEAINRQILNDHCIVTAITQTEISTLFQLSRKSGYMTMQTFYSQSSEEVGLSDIIEEDNWTSEWSHCKTIQVNNTLFLALFKESTGDFHLNIINKYYTLGEEKMRYEWDLDYSNVEIIESETLSALGSYQGNYLLLLKEKDGKVLTYNIDASGDITTKTFEDNWTSGWSSAKFFYLENQEKIVTIRNNYLLLYKKETGLIHINTIDIGGIIGDYEESSIEKGWDIFETFYIQSKRTKEKSWYLFLYNSGTGTYNVRELNKKSKVGKIIDSGTWTKNWSEARFYKTNNGIFLYLNKSSTGDVHINSVDTSGKISKNPTKEYSRGTGRTTSCFIEISSESNIETYLMIIKSGDGTMHYYSILNDGGIGDLIFSDTWTEGWTHARFLQNSHGYSVILGKQNGPDSLE